jgi:hypothetical protein
MESSAAGDLRPLGSGTCARRRLAVSVQSGGRVIAQISRRALAPLSMVRSHHRLQAFVDGGLVFEGRPVEESHAVEFFAAVSPT